MQKLPRFAYFPFGGGPRQCIGNSFATMEATLLLATIAQRFRMRLVPGNVVEPVPSFTLRPKHGIPMTLQGRDLQANKPAKPDSLVSRKIPSGLPVSYPRA